MIPFASGSVLALNTLGDGSAGVPALLGFGSSNSGPDNLGPTIDLTSNGATLNFAFSLSNSGTVTSIAAFFSLSDPLTIVGTTITISAQLYESTTLDNIFTPLAGSTVTLAPAFTGTPATGDSSSVLATGLSIPVTAGSRLLMVISATAAGASLANSLSGYASAGITID
jgi:BclB C-terminal domain-containing protein